MGSKSAVRKAKQRVHRNVEVVLPEPLSGCDVHVHIGPTNSGKTHDSVQVLLSHRSGVFAAPLRMLASEMYHRIGSQIGYESVGLLTGEERTNPHARFICCTTEVAPLDADVIVLDEAHWAGDATRGYAWTRVMTHGRYRRMEVIGSADALPLLQRMFPERTTILHDRLGALRWTGKVDRRLLEPHDAIVSFSRHHTLRTARMLAEQYGARRIAVLYGSMPQETRQHQLRRVLDGEADIVCCTDVIGHGLNLPIRRMLFAQTEKFDGHHVRPLLPWEAAQIAGRAGRANMFPEGSVGIFGGAEGRTPEAWVVQAGLSPDVPVAPGVHAFDPVPAAKLRPELDHLHLDDPTWMPEALRAWQVSAEQTLSDHPWLQPEDLTMLRRRAEVACIHQHGAERTSLCAEDLWAISQSPTDPELPEDRDLIGAMVRAFRYDLTALRSFLDPRAKINDMSLADAERSAQVAGVLRWSALRLNHPGDLYERAVTMERQAAARITQQIDVALQRPLNSGTARLSRKSSSQSYRPAFAH